MLFRSVSGFEPGDDSEVENLVRHPDENEPFSALAFKIAAHPFYGKLTFIRVYSGKMEAGSQIMNSTKGKRERISKIFQMHSNKENPVDLAHAGHIYAVIGLKDTTTGDTLCDLNDQIVLESMTFPKPVIHVAVEPKSKADQEKMGVAIQKLAEEDPTFTVELDQESGQTIIGGMGELHLDIIVDRMRREFKVEANVGKPMVAYRETIRWPARPRNRGSRRSAARAGTGAWRSSGSARRSRPGGTARWSRRREAAHRTLRRRRPGLRHG